MILKSFLYPPLFSFSEVASKIKKMNHFIGWFQKEMSTFTPENKDSLIVLNVSINQLSPMQVFGQKFIDIEMLTDKKGTLIV